MDIASIPSSMRYALSAMSSIQDRIDQLQMRISTGKRVVDPSDDPSAYFSAAGLSSRANAISGLMSAVSNAQNAVTAANKGISAIQSLLTSVQNIANQALASPASLVTITGTNSSALTTSTRICTTTGNSTNFKAGDTVTVSDGTTTATYTATNGDTVQTFLNAINNTANLKVAASLNSNGQIQLAATANLSVTIGATVNAPGGTLTSITGLTAGITAPAINTVRQSLATQFDNMRSQIDAAAQDASFNGINFLTGSSQTVTFNETGTSKLTITGSQATSNALGLAASTNSFQADTDINTALSNVTKALSSLQTISGSIGTSGTVLSARTDFNKALIDMLNSGASDLTANDMNADTAELTALQTRQQIAAASLSLTKAGSTTALRLLGF